MFIENRCAYFFGLRNACKVAEMIHGKQDINIPGFADRLTVIECPTHGELFGILINDVRNLTEDCGSLPGCCLFPGV